MKCRRYISKNEIGLTLVELLAVIVILGVLAGIAVPAYMRYVDKANVEVCNFNRNSIAKDYELDLIINEKKLSEVVFQEFMWMKALEGCPVGGVYSYGDDGEIQCSRHSDNGPDVEDGDNNENIETEGPWL